MESKLTQRILKFILGFITMYLILQKVGLTYNQIKKYCTLSLERQLHLITQ